jgi:hypothetical protein
MDINSTEEIIEELRAGRMVIIMTTRTARTRATSCSPPTA